MKSLYPLFHLQKVWEDFVENFIEFVQFLYLLLPAHIKVQRRFWLIFGYLWVHVDLFIYLQKKIKCCAFRHLHVKERKKERMPLIALQYLSNLEVNKKAIWIRENFNFMDSQKFRKLKSTFGKILTSFSKWLQ